MLGEIDASALRRRTTKHEGGAGWRVDLLVVVHFEDLNVEFVVEGLRYALDQSCEEIDSHAHIAGLDDHRAAARLCDQVFVLAGEPGGADDMDHSPSACELGKCHGSSGNREVEQAVGVRKQRLDIAGDLDPV